MLFHIVFSIPFAEGVFTLLPHELRPGDLLDVQVPLQGVDLGLHFVAVNAGWLFVEERHAFMFVRALVFVFPVSDVQSWDLVVQRPLAGSVGT